MNRLAALGVTRPNFLLLTPVCIALGVAAALFSGQEIDWSLLWAVALGGLMAHASVNALNEYVDFHSGLDFTTQRTPFSGGSGTLVTHPQLASTALAIGVVSLLITLLCGLYLMAHSGWGLLPLGLLGALVILFYSGPINRSPFLVLISPGLGFGPLMVMGTEYALTGQFSLVGGLVALVPFFQVSNLLYLNQFPDIQPDQAVGRKNFAIALSARPRANLYALFGTAPFALILLAVLAGALPPLSLLGLLTLPLFLPVARDVQGFDGRIQSLLSAMGRNVALCLLTPLLLALGLGLEVWS
ncbi:MAG: prenyltransferase [Gammaproteobacteria bacterium SHHR-1]|uniref:prenyltransferase n=1 Tax=Magnetovirga frankeli TaxID=947516 RepID=UPI001293B45A|nr:prenyltransferase [gamma proteobacterium SS-5]